MNHSGYLAATSNVTPVYVVNGPVIKQIRFGTSFGSLGPDPRYPAGATIGRAMRILLQNLGGVVPGITAMSAVGGSYMVTNIVFAEDEEGYPKTWLPLNAEYFKFARGVNTVMNHCVNGYTTMSTGVSSKEGAMETLETIAAFMRVPHSNYYQEERYQGCPGVLVLGRRSANGLADFLGWSQKQVKEWLWENSKIPWSEVVKTMGVGGAGSTPSLKAGQPYPITAKPENIMIAISGSWVSDYGVWMQQGGGGRHQPVCHEIKLPAKAKWDALLVQAEKDLGPIPQ